MSEFDAKQVTYNSKVHGETEYLIPLFDGEKGCDLSMQLNALIAPSFALATPPELFEQSDKDEDEVSLSIADILKNAGGLAKAIEVLGEKLSKPENKALVKELLSGISFKDSKTSAFVDLKKNYKTHFMKNYGALGFLLKEVVQHNDFLDLSLSFLRSSKPKEKSIEPNSETTL